MASVAAPGNTADQLPSPVVPLVDLSGHLIEQACLNCGTCLAGVYCHTCGQHAHVYRTIGAFGHDLLHSVLHLEIKI